MADHSTITHDATQSLHRSHGSFELAFAPLILALLGLWLDKTIGTVPVFTLVFAIVGMFGVAAKIFYSYRHSMAELDGQGAWVGHASSAQFRAQASARAAHLSTPLEQVAPVRPTPASPSDEILSRRTAK